VEALQPRPQGSFSIGRPPASQRHYGAEHELTLGPGKSSAKAGVLLQAIFAKKVRHSVSRKCYLLQKTDSTQATYYVYNYYHVPTDFEYVGVKTEFGHGWHLDTKPYTYSYYNQQFFNNSITTINATSAVDKLNSYRKYGDNFVATQVSKYGVFRAGMWYEWATTNRFQTPSDPRTRLDIAVPNFHENFFTSSYQPFAEYEYHVTAKLSLTAGFKYARYDQDLTQFADGKTVGQWEK